MQPAEAQARLLRKVISGCRRHGVKVELLPQRYVDKALCTGSFCDADKVLTIALRSPYWDEVLAHEYCHALQWVSGLWKGPSWDARWLTYDEWMETGKANPDKLLAAVRAIQACELDAEKRCDWLLRQCGYPKDRVRIQAANAYVLSYELDRRVRWRYRKHPSKSPKVIRSMPTTWLKDFGSLPECYLRAAKRRRIK